MTNAVPDTIYALSSGSPPAAIAVIRISGLQADSALKQMTGALPEPRRATLAIVSDPVSRERLDEALLLRFPAPHSATGEDIAELHVHGGRAVVTAVLAALGRIEGLRPAEAGEFTRRAFSNGRIDLAEAEGLADLLTAETEAQRRAATSLAGGVLSRKVTEWQNQVLKLSARVEAALDFADESDVASELEPGWYAALDNLIADIQRWHRLPSSERLRDGIRVVIAGPPNAGKSSLLNALAGREAAITSPVAGTTRDIVEAPTAIDGIAFLLADTAGIRASNDPVEVIGVERAQDAMESADIVLWLGDPAHVLKRDRTIIVRAKADIERRSNGEGLDVSALTGQGLPELIAAVQHKCNDLLPSVGEVAINRRHRHIMAEALRYLACTEGQTDLLIIAEELRLARHNFDLLTGRADVEDMLDRLFSTLCIGK